MDHLYRSQEQPSLQLFSKQNVKTKGFNKIINLKKTTFVFSRSWIMRELENECLVHLVTPDISLEDHCHHCRGGSLTKQ